MKKLFAFISILAVAAAALFADVSAKKNADGTVDVTFFYGNPRASEVLLAGDFTSWQDGALPMTKGEKGFSITRTFKMGEEARYKFISDGNWTTDLRAPDFVDDGFGGKNSHIVVADLVAGDGDDSGSAKAKINFVSWTMMGVQADYLTQGAIDKSEKGLDLNSVTIGMKSYNKFVGSFIPNCPVYIEIALAETELEDYAGNKESSLNYIYKKDAFDNVTIDWDEGFKNLVSGLVSNPVAYMSSTTNNKTGSSWGSIPGPGSNPFLGHLKFGFNTPYINFLTGFNYAKPDVRQSVIWTTVCSSWDAGYHHVGGFNVFSLGSKAVAALEEATGMTFDIGFAPNKTADRKGTKYGYWGWASAKINDLVIDFQTNGMYNGDYMFYEPVEHDFIIGAKDKIGDFSFAVQALIATHQKKTDEIKAFNKADGNAGSVRDYFGYSTDVWYRSGDFDGIQNMAANAQVGYKTDMFNVNLEYRFRGMQASMLYLRENHDDATFDLSSTLGVLNSQRIAFNGSVTPIEALKIDLGVNAEMALSELKAGDKEFDGWMSELDDANDWWVKRGFIDEDAPLFNRTGGAEFTFKPAVAYTLEDYNITIGAYGDMNYQAYKWSDGIDEDEANKYGASDSPFRFKKAGATFSMKPDSDIVKGVNVYYGLDMSNSVKYFNTLIGQVKFPMDITANLAIGIKTENTASKNNGFDSDKNNPFAFALGVSKQFKAMKKPVVYAQFVYNMDPFKHFGDGQDNLNLDRANVKGSWAKESTTNDVRDAVNWYDGRAAMRVGIRWDI